MWATGLKSKRERVGFFIFVLCVNMKWEARTLHSGRFCPCVELSLFELNCPKDLPDEPWKEIPLFPRESWTAASATYVRNAHSLQCHLYFTPHVTGNDIFGSPNCRSPPFVFLERKYDRHCHQECSAVRLQTQRVQIERIRPWREYHSGSSGGFFGFCCFCFFFIHCYLLAQR